MNELIELEARPAETAVTGRDRQSGQADFIKGFLVSLARRQAKAEPHPSGRIAGQQDGASAAPISDNPLSGAKGVGIAVVFGALIWACIGMPIWYLFAG